MSIYVNSDFLNDILFLILQNLQIFTTVELALWGDALQNFDICQIKI